jgi:chromosomal replication initiator protein
MEPMNSNPQSASLDLHQQWTQVQGLLRAEVGDLTFNTWLAPLQLLGPEGDRIVFAVPTRFLRDWVDSHYADRIRSLWRRFNPQIGGVTVVVQPVATVAEPAPPTPAEALPPRAEDTSGLDEIGAPLDPRATFENFVVGKPNELAFAAAKRVAELETPPFNPLFLYGGVGLGKTHLMHAIAWEIRRAAPGRRPRSSCTSSSRRCASVTP